MASEVVWNDYIRSYFRVTLANPPLLPACLRGRYRFQYLAEFDQRNLRLLATSTSELQAELMRIGDIGCDATHASPSSSYAALHNMFALPRGTVSFTTLQRMTDIASELAQRGATTGLPEELCFSSDTLVPGSIVLLATRPSNDEVAQRTRLGGAAFKGPWHNVFTNEYRVNSVVNGVVSLVLCEGDYIAFDSTMPFVHELLVSSGRTQSHQSEPNGPCIFSTHPFRKHLTVARANVHHRAIVPNEDLRRCALRALEAETSDESEGEYQMSDDSDSES